jgi:hypothetical protein
VEFERPRNRQGLPPPRSGGTRGAQQQLRFNAARRPYHTSSQPTIHARASPRLARPITNWIWAVSVLYAIFTITVAILAVLKAKSATLDYVRKYPAPVNFAGVWKYFGLVPVAYSRDSYTIQREWVGLLFSCLGLSTLLFGLHLADLLGGLARDEATWRRATTAARGTSPNSSLILDTFCNWPSCIILVYRSVIPWVLSYGFTCISDIFLAVFPLLTVMMLFLSLALLAEYLIRKKPKGSQPSTYGDVRALVALVDDWQHEKIFWGDKGLLGDAPESDVRLAGDGRSPVSRFGAECFVQGLVPGVDAMNPAAVD